MKTPVERVGLLGYGFLSDASGLGGLGLAACKKNGPAG